MIRVATKLKRWGNSIGITLPRKMLQQHKLHIDDSVEIVLEKKQNPLQEAFGKLHHKINTKKILKEVDKDLAVKD